MSFPLCRRASAPLLGVFLGLVVVLASAAVTSAHADFVDDEQTYLNAQAAATHNFIDGEQAFVASEFAQTQAATDAEQGFLADEMARTNAFIDGEQAFLAAAGCTGSCFNLQPFLDDEQRFLDGEHAALQQFINDEQAFLNPEHAALQQFIEDEQAFLRDEQSKLNAFIDGEQACVNADPCDEAMGNAFDQIEDPLAAENCALEDRAFDLLTVELANSEGGQGPTSRANCHDYQTNVYRADRRFPDGEASTNGSYSHKIINNIHISHCSFTYVVLGTKHDYPHCKGAVQLSNKKGETRAGTKFSGAGGAGDEIGGYFPRQPGYPLCSSQSGVENAGGYPDGPPGESHLFANCYYKYG